MASSTEELLSIARSGFGEIGYQEELLLPRYQFADFLSPSYPVREIQLAGFVQQPPSYRTASFGVLLAPDANERIADFMALGAPHVFVIDPGAGEVDRWIFQVAKRPQRVGTISSDALLATIRARSHDWGPESVLRAKSIGAHAAPVQLDFADYGLLPALEREAYQKLDQLFERALTVTSEAYRQRHQKVLGAEDYRSLFRLIFRLVAAKLLTDRRHPGNWADPNVNVVIRDVNKFYFKTSKPEQILPGIAVQQAAWDEIRTGFHLQNISLEALAYVYENTFVSRELRQVYGTHATPPGVAEFMVQQLPFEVILHDQRTVFEPFAGHAPFLTAALSRLRSLLSPSVGVDARHEYLVRMLSGIELDSFACEIAWHSLILADYPNPNGWRIEEANAFTSPKFREFLTGANVVLCNPPFGQFTAQERAQYTNLQAANKAVEVLLRVLETPPLMLGFVLPRSFTDGQSYRAARKRLADVYGNISLIALPDIAFRFSEAETVVLLAYDRAATERKWYRAFIAKRDYEQFWRTGRPTWEDVEYVDTPVGPEPQLWKEPLARNLKEQLKELTLLGQVANIHRGIEYIGPVEDHVSTSPQQGFAPGLQNVEDGLEPYIIRQWKYLQVDPAVMRWKAYLHPWHEKKVIVNAARISRGPWRIVAAVDEAGLVCYQRFHGIWPKDDTPLELIAAVLNGPVANTLLSASTTARDNLLRELKSIPLPRLSAHDIALVRELVHAYRSLPDRRTEQSGQRYLDPSDDLIVQIDSIILSGYALPDWLEAKLMDFIGLAKRPHSSLSFVEQLRYRHGRSVDKKFTEGLSGIEAQELNHIERLLDASEASYYAPIQARLAGHVRSDARTILKQVVLRGFKSIKDMHLELRPLNVLIGANGAGKSNFVSFFKMLHAMMAGRLQNYIGTAGYAHSLLHYGPKTTAQVEATLQFEVENGVDTYHMTLVHTAGDTLIFAEETLSFVQTGWSGQSKEVRLGAGHQETRVSNAADRGEPIAEAVRDLLNHCRVYQFHDTSATARIRQYCYVGDDRWLRPDAGNLAAVLYRLRHQDTSPAYRRIVGTIRQIAPFFGDFELQPTGPGNKDIILNWWEKDSDQIFGPHQLSDGTLRAISLITLLLQPVQDLPDLLIVDEPELGLHPAAKNIVAELLQKASHHCQVIVATQSSALLDMFEPDDVIVVDRVDRQSTFQRLDPVSLQEWLEEYTLGQLWEKNVLGGGPF